MSPLSNGNPTAAELDRAIVAKRAYDAAVSEGKPEAEALDIAKTAVREHHQKQILRSVGVEC